MFKYVLVTIASVGAYYTYDFVQKRRPDVRFQQSEFGVYVFPLENDLDKKMTRVLAAALNASLKPPKGGTVKVFVSDLEMPKNHLELREFMDRRNAALILRGTVLSNGKECYITLLKRVVFCTRTPNSDCAS